MPTQQTGLNFFKSEIFLDWGFKISIFDASA